MKKTLTIFLCLMLMHMASAQSQTTRIEQNLSVYNDVLRQLDISYADTLPYQKLLDAAITSMLRQIDPYTVYIPEEKNEDLKRMTTGKYGGVGAIITQRDSLVYVSEPYEGMPAQANDVRAGDVLLSVDGHDCKGKTVSDVSGWLRGKADSPVALVIKRHGVDQPIQRTFMRAEIKLPAVTYSTLLSNQVAYIHFSEFTEGSAKELRRALDGLVADGAQSLVLDLRNNGGGIIGEALELLSFFLPRGTEVVSTKGKNPNACHVYRTMTEPLYPEMPIVVLVNGNSASASEITCGALQDLHRAKLVGEKTYGKGLVQTIRPIVYNGNLKVTTSRYYLPSGRCIQGTGIEPDTVLSDSGKVDITYALYRANHFFDYATRYRAEHESILPVDEFSVTDDVIRDFIAYLHECDFTYDTETSKFLADAIKMAEQEDVDTAVLGHLRDVEEQLQHLDYEAAIWRHRDEIQEFLGHELVLRYYFQKGGSAYALRYDTWLQVALEILKL